MKNILLSFAAPLLVGPLTFMLMQGVKHASSWVESQSSLVKRVLVAVIAVALTLLAKLAGVEIACDINADANCLAMLDHDTVKALVAAGVAFALHSGKRAMKFPSDR